MLSVGLELKLKELRMLCRAGRCQWVFFFGLTQMLLHYMPYVNFLAFIPDEDQQLA